MSWFSNLRTATKLAVCFSVLLILLVGTGVLGVSATSDANASLDVTYTRDLIGLDHTRMAQIETLRIGRTFRVAMLSADEAKRAELMQEVGRYEIEAQRHLEAMEKLLVQPENRVRAAEAKKLTPEYVALGREAMRLLVTNPKEGHAAHDRFTEVGNHIGALLTPVATAKLELTQRTFQESLARASRSRTMMIGAVAVSVLAGILLAYFVGRSMSEPLAKAVVVLDKVAAGDLSVRLDVDQSDEVGLMAVALNHTLDAIHKTLVDVNAVSLEVSSASAELASSAQQISSGAQEQAASLEETAASLEEISSTVKQNTDNAQHASQLASGARDAAERGGEVVRSAVLAMTEITRASKKIADIITTIDEIAFQTNLLALNAAVEAARAGEQGRGFGVVAAEVRSLAQRTATAAKEIRGLIADSGNKVEVGTQQVNQSGETLVEIVTSVKRVTDMVAEIAAASREQNTGLDQVNTAVTQVDQVTQLNASQTEELSATATALSDKSAELQRLVGAFQLGGDGPAPVAKPNRLAAPVAKAGASRPRRRGAREMSVRQPVLSAASGVEEF